MREAYADIRNRLFNPPASEPKAVPVRNGHSFNERVLVRNGHSFNEHVLVFYRHRLSQRVAAQVAANAESRTLLSRIAGYYGVSLNDLMGPSRRRCVCEARHIAAWALRKRTRLSLTQIGRRLGNRDHTTILYSIGVVDRWIADGDSRVYPILQKQFPWDVVS